MLCGLGCPQRRPGLGLNSDTSLWNSYWVCLSEPLSCLESGVQLCLLAGGQSRGSQGQLLTSVLLSSWGGEGIVFFSGADFVLLMLQCLPTSSSRTRPMSAGDLGELILAWEYCEQRGVALAREPMGWLGAAALARWGCKGSSMAALPHRRACGLSSHRLAGSWRWLRFSPWGQI